MSGLTGLTGSDCGILFQKQKGSLFMVKVKTIFCILCVCNPLFTSQHSLFWDMRLWPPLGGTNSVVFQQHLPHKRLQQMMSNILCQLYSPLLPNILQLHLLIRPNHNRPPHHHPTGKPSSNRPVTK